MRKITKRSRAPGAKRVGVAGAAALFGLYLVAKLGPPLRRYLRMRRM